MAKSNSYTYRKIYEEHYGPIPIDDNNRTYEIHHIDGNRENNSPDNLIALSIKEHYDLHYKQGDYGACVMIAKRMKLPSDHISKIQTGVKRPGIGGVKKGTPNKFKGKKRGPFKVSEEGRKRQELARKRNNKITDEEAEEIRQFYKEKIKIENDLIGKTMKNGKIFSYERAFAKYFGQKFDVTDQYIYRIIKGRSKIV